MGLILQFYIGNKDEIVDAVAYEDFVVLEELEHGNKLADFSLHIEPNDLNLLLEVIAEYKGQNKISLRENLDTEKCFFDETDRGAYFVKPIIQSLVSNCSVNDIAGIAQLWYAKLSEVHIS
jgi:hypothetical protein